MKVFRTTLVAIMLCLTCLFAMQSAGAASAPSASAVDTVCDDIGPQPMRLAPLGLGINGPQISLTQAALIIPACYESTVLTDAPVAADDVLTCETVGPNPGRLLPISGLNVGSAGAGGSLSISSAPACMAPANLFPLAAPEEESDPRVCDGTPGTCISASYRGGRDL